jgi:hypothetical protein
MTAAIIFPAPMKNIIGLYGSINGRDRSGRIFQVKNMLVYLPLAIIDKIFIRRHYAT